MNVLVTAASRHGCTVEIADRVVEVLRRHGHRVELLPPETVRSLDGFSAVVLGSAVYTGDWLRPARDFAERFTGELPDLPLWLFSSGPVGDPPVPADGVPRIDELARHLGARDHCVFPGELDPDTLGLRERLVVRAVKAVPGDYRDWAGIEAWAEDIARTLEEEEARAASSPGRSR